MNLITKLKEAVQYANKVELVYGTQFDQTVDSITNTDGELLVYCDPLQYTIDYTNDVKVYSVQMVFLKRDKSDSQFDTDLNEIESDSTLQIQEDMSVEADTFVQYLIDNYSVSIPSPVQVLPAIKIRDLCSGVFIQFSVQERVQC